MLELPEIETIAKQLGALRGKRVSRVLPPTSVHKFCWFSKEPEEYNKELEGSLVALAEGFGMFVELSFNNGRRICFNDGVNARLVQEDEMPQKRQLAICFEDGSALVFSVAMYGGIYLHDGDFDNIYYLKSRSAVSPFSKGFEDYCYRTLAEAEPKLTAKAFLATQQRFPGVGNGVAQDILFDARINPKSKIAALSQSEREQMLKSMVAVLKSMAALGGRDTERDLFGNCGGYKTLMSKNTAGTACPVCGEEIKKENYLGGSVYYCEHCQPVKKAVK